MNLIYSRRALADLERIAAYYAANASPAIAEAIELRLSNVIERILQTPEATPRLSQRSLVRVITVVRYSFRIFYRVRGDSVDILHIRHTSRRPLSGVE
jgi:toxin ParE1/3/4